MCEIPQGILDAVKVITCLKSRVGNAGSENKLMGVFSVECCQANAIAEQTVAIGINPNIVAGGIAVDILEITAMQDYSKVVERDLQLWIFLEGAEEFVKTPGLGGVDGRQAERNSPGIQLVERDIALQRGHILGKVKLDNDTAIEIGVAADDRAVIEFVLVVSLDLGVAQPIASKVNMLDITGKMCLQGLKVISIQRRRGHLSIHREMRSCDAQDLGIVSQTCKIQAR